MSVGLLVYVFPCLCAYVCVRVCEKREKTDRGEREIELCLCFGTSNIPPDIFLCFGKLFGIVSSCFLHLPSLFLDGN